MPSRGLGAYSVKIHQLVFGGLFVLMLLFGVRGMMAGGTSNIKLLAAASILIGVVLALDKYYWVLALFFVASGLNLPVLPFGGAEIGCLALIGVYFIRQAMQKEHSIKISWNVLIAFPVFIWICAIWVLNPTGMAILGSSSIGARFYFRIVLGFFAFLVLSTFRFSEKDCKILFYCLIVAGIFSFIQSIVLHEFRVEELNSIGVGVTSSSQYHLLGALSLYLLLFSRYSVPHILKSLPKLLLTIVLAGIVVLSGKRQAFGTLFVIPIVRALITRKDYLVTGVCFFVFALVSSIAVLGHGSIWELPSSAQRALSVVVPAFETQSAMGTADVFREGVNRFAREEIRRSPWVGRKGYAMSRDTTSWITFSSPRGGDSLYEGHAFVGNWHNLWYAFASDFGLPCLFLFIVFALGILRNVFRLYPQCIGNEYMMACFLFYGYQLSTSFLFASVAGHSSLSLQGIFINYGFLLAIANGAKNAMLNSTQSVAVISRSGDVL